MATAQNTNLPVHQYVPAFYSGAKVRRAEVSMEYTAVTANTTLVMNTNGNAGTCHYLVENTSGSNTIMLPTAVGFYGMGFIIKNSVSGTVTLAAPAGQTIDGASTQSIAQYAALNPVSNGTNWILI
jgi:hypothetical protein